MTTEYQTNFSEVRGGFAFTIIIGEKGFGEKRSFVLSLRAASISWWVWGPGLGQATSDLGQAAAVRRQGTRHQGEQPEESGERERERERERKIQEFVSRCGVCPALATAQLSCDLCVSESIGNRLGTTMSRNLISSSGGGMQIKHFSLRVYLFRILSFDSANEMVITVAGRQLPETVAGVVTN